jgi:Skp family chaperone for outer membrane proteins
MKKIGLSTRFPLLLAFMWLALSSAEALAQSKTSSTFNEFKDWVSRTTSSASDKTEEEWEQVKTEYKDLTSRLDKEEDKLSASAKKEYKQLKADFSKTEAGLKTRWQNMKASESMASQSSLSAQTMLGEKYGNIESLEPHQMKDAYREFIMHVRANSNNWTDADWKQAKNVYQQLSDKREGMMNIPTSDEASIQTLQAEFNAMRGGHEIKESYKSVRGKN